MLRWKGVSAGGHSAPKGRRVSSVISIRDPSRRVSIRSISVQTSGRKPLTSMRSRGGRAPPERSVGPAELAVVPGDDPLGPDQDRDALRPGTPDHGIRALPGGRAREVSDAADPAQRLLHDLEVIDHLGLAVDHDAAQLVVLLAR